MPAPSSNCRPPDMTGALAVEVELPKLWLEMTATDAGPGRGAVQVRVTPETRNPFRIKALSISSVTWKWHVLNHAGFCRVDADHANAHCGRLPCCGSRQPHL